MKKKKVYGYHIEVQRDDTVSSREFIIYTYRNWWRGYGEKFKNDNVHSIELYFLNGGYKYYRVTAMKSEIDYLDSRNFTTHEYLYVTINNILDD